MQTPLRGQRNLLLFEVGYSGVGTQYDERTAALGSPTLLSRYDWLDLRGGLRIGDAELFAALDNLLDATASETLGTGRRPRQLRLGLNWSIWN
jgi:outer membrane receptor protein involved in Fe transport